MSRKIGLRLFLAAFLIYNVNMRPIPSGDTTATALLPFRIVQSFSLNLDPYERPLYKLYAGINYFLHESNGHFYSSYPIAQPVILSPLYMPIALLPSVQNLPMGELLLLARAIEKILGSLITAGSVWAMFVIFTKMTTLPRAVLLASTYAFATSAWATSSQALWQHGASQLCIALSLLFLSRYIGDNKQMWAGIGAGFFAALSVSMRPTDVAFYGASLAVVMLWQRRRLLIAAYLGFGALVAGLLASYNYVTFGRVRGWYINDLNFPLGEGLAGVLLSPGRGLLVYTPVLIFVPLGVWLWLRSPNDRKNVLYWIALLFSIGHIVLIARWPVWWGGYCYGPRLLTDALPCLALLMLPALDWIAQHRPARAAFAATLVFSIAVQFIGAFSFPKAAFGNERVWEWSMCPIYTNARAGILWEHYVTLAVWTRDFLTGRPIKTGSSVNFVR